MAEATDLLKSIDGSLRRLVDLLESALPKPVASDADLDGQYGNPNVTQKDPTDWKGPSMNGRRLSECPAEYLDLLASRHDYFARKADEEGKVTESGKPVAPFERRSAARARGWAKRVREGNGHAAPVQQDFASAAPVSDDDIAF
jgi:hypothetical protein